MWCTWFTENTGRKSSPYAHRRTTLSDYIFASKACIDNRKNSNISSTCPHNMLNGWDQLASLGTPANFNRFRVLASLLHRRRWTKVNQTLQYVRPSPWLVHCVYIFGILPGAKFTLRPNLAFPYYIGSVTWRSSVTRAVEFRCCSDCHCSLLQAGSNSHHTRVQYTFRSRAAIPNRDCFSSYGRPMQ